MTELKYSKLENNTLTLIDYDEESYYDSGRESGYFYCTECRKNLRPDPVKIIRTIDYPENHDEWKKDFPYDMIYFFCKDCSNGVNSYSLSKLD